MDTADDFEARLGWWRVHCVAIVSVVPLLVAAVVIEHVAAAIPVGLGLAFGSYAGVKAGRSLLGRRSWYTESETIGDGVGDEDDAYGGAGSVIGIFIGLTIAGWGVVQLVRDLV